MRISRRRRRWNLVLLAGLLAAMAVGAFAVKQPVMGRGPKLPSAEVAPLRLQAHVRMLSETLSPRGHEDTQNLNQVAGYVASALREAGAEVSEQRYRTRYDTEFRNIIGVIGPRTDQVIVVGAHYDAFAGLPGADDNASGVAGLIELAGLLAKHPPRMRVELVAYSTEEPPYFRTEEMGSDQHAAWLVARGEKVRAMIALEMLGSYSDEPGSQRYPMPILRLLYPGTGNFIAVVGKTGQGALVRTVKRAMRGASDLPVQSINAPRFVPGLDFSDHAPYWDRGMNALMITDTAFYRNPRYHTAQDTWNTLDYARMAKVVQGVFAAVHALAAED
jgi:Zn-dependent M28 family amino/carboxypeptidase